MSKRPPPVDIGLDGAADVTPKPRGVKAFFGDTEVRTHENTEVRIAAPPNARPIERSQIRRPEKPDRMRFPKITARVWPKFHDEFEDLVKRIQRRNRGKHVTAEEVMEALIAMGNRDIAVGPQKSFLTRWFTEDTHLQRYGDIESEDDDF